MAIIIVTRKGDIMNFKSIFKVKKRFDQMLLDKDPQLFYSKIVALATGAFVIGRLTKK
jgi:hypothetical protein